MIDFCGSSRVGGGDDETDQPLVIGRVELRVLKDRLDLFLCVLLKEYVIECNTSTGLIRDGPAETTPSRPRIPLSLCMLGWNQQVGLTLQMCAHSFMMLAEPMVLTASRTRASLFPRLPSLAMAI